MSQGRLEALLKIACKYVEQAPALAQMLKDVGREDILNQPPEPGPSDTTLKKLECLQDLDLDESTGKFVQSLQGRADGGRALTVAQIGALDKIVQDYAAQIKDFETLSPSLGITTSSERGEDAESGKLLDALAPVQTWREPVTRGKRVFDDEKFYQSLSAHYKRKQFLSPRQKGALKKLVYRYKEQIPDFEKVEDICRPEPKKKAEGA